MNTVRASPRRPTIPDTTKNHTETSIVRSPHDTVFEAEHDNPTATNVTKSELVR
jgi:hypothetical protein